MITIIIDHKTKFKTYKTLNKKQDVVSFLFFQGKKPTPEALEDAFSGVDVDDDGRGTSEAKRRKIHLPEELQ